MYPLVLQEPVMVTGPSFISNRFRPHQGAISFLPHPCAWVWQLPTYTLALTPHRIVRNSDKLRLHELTEDTKRHEWIEDWMYIGALRWFGLTGVRIDSTNWPPFDGSGKQFWNALKEKCIVDTSKEIPWYTTAKEFYSSYRNRYTGNLGVTQFFPSNKKKLTITISLEIPHLGKVTNQKFTFPNKQLLESILEIPGPSVRGKTSGYIAKHMFGWPHFDHVSWRNGNAEAALRKFTLHRALEILATMSLLCKDGLLSGHIESQYSGSPADAAIARQAFEHLVPLSQT
jgi:hypothetical protein